MDLIQLLVIVIVLGLAYYVITMLLPIPEPFRKAVAAILIVIACYYLLTSVGLCSGAPHLRIAR